MKHIRIQYITFNDPYASSGVHKKEQEFCEAMGELCREREVAFQGVNIFTSEHADGSSLFDSEHFCYRKAEGRLHRIFGQTRFVRALFRIRPMLKAAYNAIRQFDPDIILWRYDIINVPGFFNPKRIKPDVLFVSEHQTKEMEELALSLAGRIKIPLLRLYEKRIFLRSVDALVGVTTEIAEYERMRLGRTIPIYVHTNGINVKLCTQAQYTPFTGDVMKLVFVGSATARWHGIDRLLRGIARYHGDVRIELHMVGIVTPDIQDLIASLDIGGKIIFHGVCYGGDLDAIFNQAHMAVGTLGIHRQNLHYGSTLKVREYMARGVPFLLSYIDEDIEDDFPLCLRLRADESAVDMDEVVQFMTDIEKQYGQRIPSLMRSYALEHMDYEKKVRDLLQFLMSLTDSGR